VNTALKEGVLNLVKKINEDSEEGIANAPSYIYI
jgi:hypothetical protein